MTIIIKCLKNFLYEIHEETRYIIVCSFSGRSKDREWQFVLFCICFIIVLYLIFVSFFGLVLLQFFNWGIISWIYWNIQVLRICNFI